MMNTSDMNQAFDNNLTSNDSMHEAKEELIDFYNRMTLIMWRYVLMIPLFGGLLANLFCLLTLQMSSFRESGSGFLLTALTVVDMLALGVGALHAWILALFNIDLRLFTVQGCRVHVYFTYLTVHLSAWTLSLITLERLIAVTRPLQVAWLCTRKRLAVGWATITITLALTNMYLPFQITIEDIVDKTTNTTITSRCIMIFVKNYDFFQWLDLTISFFAPYTIIACGNLAILVKRIRTSRRDIGRSIELKTGSITMMLLAANMFFLVTTLPVNIYLLGYNLFFPPEHYNMLLAVKSFFVESLVTMIYYCNNAGNFVLYLLSGRRFRKAVKDVFFGHKKKIRTTINTIAYSTSHNTSLEHDNTTAESSQL